MKSPRKRKPTRAEIAAEKDLAELESLLGKLSVQVTYDRRLEGRGGVCVVRGERRVIVQRALPASEKIDLLLEGLQDLDLSELEVPEGVRQRLQGIERARAAAPRRRGAP